MSASSPARTLFMERHTLSAAPILGTRKITSLRPTSQTSRWSLEQWGGTFGGPIRKDKLFYFGGFESQHYSVGNTFTLNVPTSAAGVGGKVSIPDAEAALATQPYCC